MKTLAVLAAVLLLLAGLLALFEDNKEDNQHHNGTCDQLFWINFNVTNRNTSIHFPVFLDQTPGKNHSMCYQQNNGNRPLGNTTNCNQTAGSGEGAPVNTTGPSNGTYWVQGMAWLCGQHAYFILPPGWTGVCAPIFISDHTFRMTAVNTTPTTRRKGRSTSPGIQPHDPVYGSDVPEEFKLWTTGQKVLHSLFPWVGTGKNMLRIETLDYRFGLFLNASCKINDEQNQEINALRIAVMQHSSIGYDSRRERRTMCPLRQHLLYLHPGQCAFLKHD
ncbi:hypothetical protein ACER0C_025128 [Sarotherodon galilaeus]